jgi:hypothetical protein
MKMQGTVFFIFYSARVFMFTSRPDKLGSLRVSRTKLVRVLMSLSDLQTFERRQVWKGVRDVSFGIWSSLSREAYHSFQALLFKFYLVFTIDWKILYLSLSFSSIQLGSWTF